MMATILATPSGELLGDSHCTHDLIPATSDSVFASVDIQKLQVERVRPVSGHMLAGHGGQSGGIRHSAFEPEPGTHGRHGPSIMTDARYRLYGPIDWDIATLVLTLHRFELEVGAGKAVPPLAYRRRLRREVRVAGQGVLVTSKYQKGVSEQAYEVLFSKPCAS